MENLVFTQLSIPEIKQLFRQELQTFFDSKALTTSQPEADEFLTIQKTAELLALSVPTIYSLVSRSEIPYMKKGKRLYFLKDEITNWIKTGRKKTIAEIDAEADSYLIKQKKGGSK